MRILPTTTEPPLTDPDFATLALARRLTRLYVSPPAGAAYPAVVLVLWLVPPRDDGKPHPRDGGWAVAMHRDTDAGWVGGVLYPADCIVEEGPNAEAARANPVPPVGLVTASAPDDSIAFVERIALAARFGVRCTFSYRKVGAVQTEYRDGTPLGTKGPLIFCRDHDRAGETRSFRLDSIGSIMARAGSALPRWVDGVGYVLGEPAKGVSGGW